MYCVMWGYVAIHEIGNESKSTCSICVGGPGRLPAPSPGSVGGAAGGWGEGWRARSCLGVLSREGGISGKQAASWNGGFFWQVNSAGYSRGWIQQVAMAGYFGRLFWRVILAHLFGGFSWPMKQAGSKEKKSKRKEGKMYTQWICKLHNDHCM